ncbi:hypothetical protein [Streptomyces sp. NBC_00887]|nr:hypothetical protein OG844_17160 [Streptomyces sp. NBC_00887]
MTNRPAAAWRSPADGTYAFDEKQNAVGDDAYLYRVEDGRPRRLGLCTAV